jgi:hypothetical protein
VQADKDEFPFLDVNHIFFFPPHTDAFIYRSFSFFVFLNGIAIVILLLTLCLCNTTVVKADWCFAGRKRKKEKR